MVHSTPATLRSWIEERELELEFRGEFTRVWAQRVESTDWLQNYAKACPVDGAHPGDYRLREISIAANDAVLAGIHFLGRQVDHPFIGVYAQTRDFEAGEIAAASFRLLEEFRLFHPRHVRWWSPAPRDLRRESGVVGDKRFVVGRISEISPLASSTCPAGLSLDAEYNIASYNEYKSIHDAFTESHPAWKGRMLSLETPETMEECARSGGLYCVRDLRRLAGVFAARPGVIRGIRGWEIAEEILDVKYRGRGLAAPLQRLFVSKLDPSQGRLIMGEIHDDNTPSLRTAMRAGRKDVGGWVFVS